MPDQLIINGVNVNLNPTAIAAIHKDHLTRLAKFAQHVADDAATAREMLDPIEANPTGRDAFDPTSREFKRYIEALALHGQYVTNGLRVVCGLAYVPFDADFVPRNQDA